MRSLEENCILSAPSRCGISCKFCNVANYIVHCLNAHLMVGEFIILYSCEIQSSGGKFKTSFINRMWKKERKVFILFRIPFDTYTGINLAILSGGVRFKSRKKHLGLKSIKTFLLFSRKILFEQRMIPKDRIGLTLSKKEFRNLGQFWIESRYKCVCVASRGIKIPAIRPLDTGWWLPWQVSYLGFNFLQFPVCIRGFSCQQRWWAWERCEASIYENG